MEEKRRQRERARARNAMTTARQDGYADKASNPANYVRERLGVYQV